MSLTKKFQALTGAQAAAQAMRQIAPSVVPVYPITPQTPIIEEFAKMVANSQVDSDIIHAESEHSVMSAAVGAQAAGVRAMTASSSAGLALMYEILGVASGLRLPVVMNVANRALSSPINIHCDHSDSMGIRDVGWIQIYSENAQEVYDHNFLALKLAEKVMLPAMVMQDGFITSHSVENLELVSDNSIQEYIERYEPDYPLLDVNHPVTVGALQLTDYYFETKRQHIEAIEKVNQIYHDMAKLLRAHTGRDYPKIEAYEMQDAQAAILVLSSTAGTAKSVCKKLRKKGLKVGVIKPRLFTPFPQNELADLLRDLKYLAILDRATSPGSDAPLAKEVNSALLKQEFKPLIQYCVFGLGGREIYEKNLEDLYHDLLNEKITDQVKYLGLRE
ncbi:MAG: pyruvate ferredoxin oxidoreductase [Candidatus Moranbacteria bacterium]|nr:pyruvate ferredoxin oxidoreductase [Candidatus Moranbacteria bacterium]